MAVLNRLLPSIRVRPSLASSRAPAFPTPTLTRTTPVTSHLFHNTPKYADNDTTDPPKLAKPTKFNPPSHPSRLPRTTSGYNSQRSYNFPKDAPVPRPLGYYPHTLPPEGTWHNWFLTSRTLHFYISLSILFILAGIVSVTNFMKTSPFAGLVPEWNWWHPINGILGFWDAWKMHFEWSSREAMERRKRQLEDVEKRGEFRRRHGLEQEGEQGGFGGWALKRKKSEGREGGQVDAVEVQSEHSR